MRLREAQAKVKEALKQLHATDGSLLERDISERAIAHQFAVKLSSLFHKYDVDCEYNGNVTASGVDIRKKVEFLIIDLKKVKDKYRNEVFLDGDSEHLGVFPDIIIHERKTNKTNLLIIEVKKSNSRPDEIEFDRLKMEYYTKIFDSKQKPFVYKYGLLITFSCKQRFGAHELEWYVNGIRKRTESFRFNLQ